ncbi:MAG: cytochrome C, partial [Opitutae bacterium]|nr:cytochrome C [Opitutae bacterium]
MKNCLVLFPAIALSFGLIHSAEPEASTEQLPRVAPVEALDAIQTFRLKKGFNIELAAAEPQVVDPVSMSFDADGKLYVVEMIGYSEHRDDKLGRVRLLEDTNDDGRFDKATVFAKGLA